MLRKIIALVVTLLLLMSLFTACAGNSSKPAEEDKKGDVQKEEAAKPTESVKPAEEKKPVKITWLDANPYAIEKMDALLAGLKDEAGIEIEIEHVANNFSEVLKTKINSGDTPDVFQNLSGVENKVYAEYSFDFTNEEVIKKFKEDAVKQCMYDGKVIGLPWNYQTYSLLYNKKVFADAGITQMPKTLKELEQVCETLKSKGITPFANGYKE